MLLAFYKQICAGALLAFYAQITSLLAYPDPMKTTTPLHSLPSGPVEEIVSELLRYLWEIPSDAHQSLSMSLSDWWLFVAMGGY